MISMPGKNNFKGLFNPFEWSAPVYETNEEVLDAYNSFGIAEKRIADVRVIGGVPRHRISTWKDDVRFMLRKSGMSDEDVEKFNDFENFQEERAVYPIDPVVFTFEDGSTFEFCPYFCGYVRMSVNTIPAHIEDGLNRSNVDLLKLIPADYIGAKLGPLTITKGSTYRWCSDAYACTVKQGCYVDYKLFVTERNSDEPEKTEISKIMNARKPVNQLYFLNARRDPCHSIHLYYKKYDALSAPDRFFIDTRNVLCVEEDLLSLLIKGDLLDRYFDKAINKRTRFGEEGYDHYGSNYYSFLSLKRMIARMRDQTDTDLSSYIDSDSRDYYFKYLTFTHDWYKEVNEAEEEEILRPYYAYLIRDFRERFYNYMEGLMNVSNLPGIYFLGP